MAFIRFQTFWFVMTSLLLFGCSHYKESFDCPMSAGITCRSISQVDHMVEQGALPEASSAPLCADKEGYRPAVSCPGKADQCGRPGVAPVYKDCTVLRHPEHHLRIWIAPFYDQHGSFHDDTTIYTVLRPGQWVRRG